MSKTVKLYTDGACSGNPGPGGWGVLMRWNGHEKEMSGGEAETTNNRMELTAVIEGLKTASKKPVKNQDLWMALDEQVQSHDVKFHWVKGHAGHPENERADSLATSAVPR